MLEEGGLLCFYVVVVSFLVSFLVSLVWVEF